MTPRSSARHGCGGFTLVEAVIALVILAAAAVGVLLVFAGPMAASADPMVRAQARALASSYMDEIVMRAYRDEAGDTECTNGGDRAAYDTIWCYAEIDDESPPQNQFGDAIMELSAYTVSVDVVADNGSATITVNVTHSSGRVDYDLASNRGDY